MSNGLTIAVHELMESWLRVRVSCSNNRTLWQEKFRSHAQTTSSVCNEIAVSAAALRGPMKVNVESNSSQSSDEELEVAQQLPEDLSEIGRTALRSKNRRGNQW